ncbi:GntR family transcriptional regulator [Halomonas cupida]|uniref:DNA-binding transcriptional regulator, GntR family n=1 Tax=Halomonas cupida TaxID=44933 RepID=A0A1M7CMZ4_9GAMM|nr:GntR family transcriptional regulator [Halomonas cupida]GEN26024.1 GntR family transcriptional regulator [Halomonas cupida]SHL68493.1 DNA-binding transcriptional regulator, GntR family [Halomonas cupida]
MRKEPGSVSALERIGQRRSNTLTSIAKEAIEEMIITGELSAGDRINESALATRFNISRGPIREACRSLEHAGLVRNVTNQGAYVREMKLDEARELYEVRRALTALVGQLLVERASDELLDELEQLVDQMSKAADEDDLDSYYSLNLEFHDTMMAGAGNASLARYYDDIVKQLHLFRRRGLVQRGNLHASNAEHRHIVEALLQRDATAASERLSDHVMAGWQRMVEAS